MVLLALLPTARERLGNHDRRAQDVLNSTRLLACPILAFREKVHLMNLSSRVVLTSLPDLSRYHLWPGGLNSFHRIRISPSRRTSSATAWSSSINPRGDMGHPSSSNPKVLLYGAGSIGGVYIYQLLQAGCNVTAVCRSNHSVVSEQGFTLKSVRFGNVNYRPTNVVRNISECSSETFDYVVVCAKSFPGSKPSLAEQLSPVLHGRNSTALVLAQNGINIEAEISAVYPENPILSGVVYCPATQTGPGTIEYPEMLSCLELGTYPSKAPSSHKAAAEAFVELMIKGGGGAEHHEDIQISRWSKLIMNAAWNPICALTLTTDGDFLNSDPYAHDLAWAVMMEIVQLAKVVGIPGVTEEVARQKYAITKKRAETGTGRKMSMMQDVEQGRSFEVEAILGNAVRLGREKGLSLPRLETLYALANARLQSIMKK